VGIQKIFIVSDITCVWLVARDSHLRYSLIMTQWKWEVELQT